MKIMRLVRRICTRDQRAPLRQTCQEYLEEAERYRTRTRYGLAVRRAFHAAAVALRHEVFLSSPQTFGDLAEVVAYALREGVVPEGLVHHVEGLQEARAAALRGDQAYPWWGGKADEGIITAERLARATWGKDWRR